MDHVSYTVGCHDRYIDRCIDRYIDRYSIDPRPTRDRHVDRLSTENVNVKCECNFMVRFSAFCFELD